MLTAGQWQTLDHICISADARQLLVACDHRIKQPGCYGFNQRLDTIAAILEHPADWRHWWLSNRNTDIGVHRPEDHDPKWDPASEILNSVIAATAQAALSRLPETADYAAGTISDAPVRLSTVWTEINLVIGMAYRLGIGPDVQAHYPSDPNLLAAELAAAGISFTTDMSRLEHPDQLREQRQWPGIDLAYCSTISGIWWHKDAANQHRMVANRFMRSRPPAPNRPGSGRYTDRSGTPPHQSHYRSAPRSLLRPSGNAGHPLPAHAPADHRHSGRQR